MHSPKKGLRGNGLLLIARRLSLQIRQTAQDTVVKKVVVVGMVDTKKETLNRIDN